MSVERLAEWFKEAYEEVKKVEAEIADLKKQLEELETVREDRLKDLRENEEYLHEEMTDGSAFIHDGHVFLLDPDNAGRIIVSKLAPDKKETADGTVEPRSERLAGKVYTGEQETR